MVAFMIGAQAGVAKHEPVSDPMADAQAQASGGPQNTGRRGAEADSTQPTGCLHALGAWVRVIGGMVGAG